MTVKNVFIFIAGAGLGALGSAIFFKKRYDRMMEEEIAEIMKVHKDAPQPVTVAKDDVDIAVYKSATSAYATSPASGPAVDIRPVGERGNTDYTQFRHADNDEEEANNTLQGETLTDERKKDRDKPPIIIDQNDVQSIPGYDAMDLYFYDGNKVLTLADDYGEERVKTLDEVRDLLGDILVETGFTTSKFRCGKSICVRNFRMSTDYVITKIAGNYEE